MLHRLRRFLAVMRCVGLAPLHYDAERDRYRADHTPTLAYCSLLNAVYLVLLPLAASRLLHATYTCRSFHLLLYLDELVAAAHIVAFVATLYGVWRQRLQCCRIVNSIVRTGRRWNGPRSLPPELAALARRRLRTKVLLCSCKLCVLLVHFYGAGAEASGHLSNCAESTVDEAAADERLLSVGFLASVSCISAMLVLQICAECSVFMALLFVDVCIGEWQHELRAVLADVQLLRDLAGQGEGAAAIGTLRWQGVWLAQLSRVVAPIASSQRRLRALLRAVIGVCQWQVLGMLFCTFVNLTSMCFNLMVQIAVMAGYNLWPILVDLSMLLAGFYNLLLLFGLCEDIRVREERMRQLVFQISMDSAAMAQTSPGRQLERALEHLSLELVLNRCQLNICGLFNLSMNTGMTMVRSIVTNFIIILQIAIKLYS